ncbi:hypothetical protein PCO31111_04818 [Pandoraea communis]|uniref:Uncharacterized protein n=1 Tax=Pandoraea communis TaxID=2508297 RepID=A0A5E4YVM3_9BURK|nr:hypothetical protein PCO31111_04818 [Pandoraea communis]
MYSWGVDVSCEKPTSWLAGLGSSGSPPVQVGVEGMTYTLCFIDEETPSCQDKMAFAVSEEIA